MAKLIGAVVLAGAAAMFVAAWLLPRPAIAQELQCIPYDKAVANVHSHGLVVLPDLPVAGFGVDRLMVSIGEDGQAYAAPVMADRDCVLTAVIPLGYPKPAAPPPKVDEMRKDRAAFKSL